MIFIAWLYGDVLGFMVDCEAWAMQYDECEITVAWMEGLALLNGRSVLRSLKQLRLHFFLEKLHVFIKS